MNNKHDPDPHETWRYKFETLERVADEFNIKLEYIGDWRHPRGQKLFCATLK